LDRLERKLDIQPQLVLPPGQGTIQGEVVSIRSGQGFQLQLTPSDTCYVYIYQLDAHNNLARLFPNPQAIPGTNPLRAGTKYRLPGGGNGFLLNQQSGQEMIYWVASRWPASDLEDIVERFHHAPRVAEKKGHRRRLERRLEVRRQAREQGVEGVFYKAHAFWHEDSNL
jgi:hypothetical protein